MSVAITFLNTQTQFRLATYCIRLRFITHYIRPHRN